MRQNATYVTQFELARILGISRQAVNQRVQSGTVPVVRFMGRSMIPREWLESDRFKAILAECQARKQEK